MKKILMSFLMMAMIAGCVDVPVVEQPEKTVEQEKPDETEVIQIETIEIEMPDDERLELDDLGPLIIQIPTIIKDGDDYDEFNQSMQEEREKYLGALRYNENDFLIESYFVNTKYFINNDVLSISIKESHMGYAAGRGAPKYFSYNFDLSKDIKLSPLDLLDRYQLNVQSAYEYLENELQKQGYSCCSVNEGVDYEDYVECYDTDYFEGYSMNYSVIIDENSVLYVNDENELIIILQINTQSIPQFIEIKLG